MKRFREEHDHYRRFLVTGDTKGRMEQNANYCSANGSGSGNGPWIVRNLSAAHTFSRSKPQLVSTLGHRQGRFEVRNGWKTWLIGAQSLGGSLIKNYASMKLKAGIMIEGLSFGVPIGDIALALQLLCS